MTLLKSVSYANEVFVKTAIAIDKDKNSQYAVRWAVDNLLSSENPQCILIHVRNQSIHPQDFDSNSKEGRPPTKDELQQFFLPYRGFCARKGIEAKEVVLHDIDVPNAIVHYITNNSIGNIVVGASNRNAFMRKFRNVDVGSTIIKSAPESCAVHVISSKGKTQSRSASRPQTPTSLANLQPDSANSFEISSSAFSRDSWKSESSGKNSCSSGSLQASPYIKFKPRSRLSTDSRGSDSSNVKSASDRSDFSQPNSSQSTDLSENFDFSFLSESSHSSSSSQTPGSLEAEMRRLRLELKQSMEMYNSACKEAILARGQTTEIEQWKNKGSRTLKDAKLAEETALALAKMDRQKTKAATEAAHMAQRLADLESRKRKTAELKIQRDAEERKRAMEAFTRTGVRYRKYTIEEIEVTTDYFSSSMKIGEGGYGPVYRGLLDHTPVAIKVLRPDLSQGLKQFKQEIEVLSSMRHPNMVLLLGACPEYGCLVYEYMENGSLEDRLFRKDNTPPMPWRTRFNIAAEIATGLLYLHQNKPEPLVHRDLKPANILLSNNYISKISDVGLARLIPPSTVDSVTRYHMTAAAGTFCYIDPEYQQTGMLGVKSDLYALGVMLLQMITAKPPMGLGHQVEKAIENGTFTEMLDPTVTDWPVDAALSFAKLALQCCELRKKDRPDLASVVLPELIRLKDFGLENEANFNKRVVDAPRPRSFLSSERRSTSQINARRGWRHLKSVTRIWGLRNSTTNKKQVGKQQQQGKLQSEGCWSLVGCSHYASERLRKFKSFS